MLILLELPFTYVCFSVGNGPEVINLTSVTTLFILRLSDSPSTEVYSVIPAHEVINCPYKSTCVYQQVNFDL